MNNTWGHELAKLPDPNTAPPPPPPDVDPLIVRYDANANGTIEKSEVITAIGDYFAGLITK